MIAFNFNLNHVFNHDNNIIHILLMLELFFVKISRISPYFIEQN